MLQLSNLLQNNEGGRPQQRRSGPMHHLRTASSPACNISAVVSSHVERRREPEQMGLVPVSQENYNRNAGAEIIALLMTQVFAAAGGLKKAKLAEESANQNPIRWTCDTDEKGKTRSETWRLALMR